MIGQNSAGLPHGEKLGGEATEFTFNSRGDFL
jgi:hypothetical protein